MTSGPRRPIVFVHSSDELYGADRMLLELVAAVPDDIAVEVWLPTDMPHPAAPLCAVLEARGVVTRHLDLPVLRRAYRTPRHLLRLAASAVRLLPTLRRRAPAVVYCTTSAVLLAAAAARVARVPTVVGHVQEFWSPADRRVLTPLARCCHRLVAISPAVAAALPPVLRARTVTVVNATPDPGPATPVAATGPLRYLVASRWNGWKGHRTLLDAWRLAGCPGRLTVLGGPPGSGESTDVRSLVAALPDPGSVDVAGEVSDPSGYVRDADVVVVPSDDPEPFGLVAIEAFARGRPVIASDAGGLADIVTDGVDGWLFPPREVAGLAGILRGLTRPDVIAAGTAARLTYDERFTVTRYADEWRAAVGLSGE